MDVSSDIFFLEAVQHSVKVDVSTQYYERKAKHCKQKITRFLDLF